MEERGLVVRCWEERLRKRARSMQKNGEKEQPKKPKNFGGTQREISLNLPPKKIWGKIQKKKEKNEKG